MVKVGNSGNKNLNSEIYDTSLSDRTNSGHEKEFKSLSEIEKDELLEYLKTI